MVRDGKNYCTQVVNPTFGLMRLSEELMAEFHLEFEELWQKKADPDKVLSKKPVHEENFNYIVRLKSDNEKVSNYVGYLLNDYQDSYLFLEYCFDM